MIRERHAESRRQRRRTCGRKLTLVRNDCGHDCSWKRRRTHSSARLHLLQVHELSVREGSLVKDLTQQRFGMFGTHSRKNEIENEQLITEKIPQKIETEIEKF